MKNDACIIGYGVVGKSTALSFGITKYFDLSGSNITLEDAAKCRYVFICLPTPTISGKQDNRTIENYIRQLATYGHSQTYIIRSTVIPGTIRRIMQSTGISSIVSNPEFLTESSWEWDAKHPRLVVIGADDPKYGDAVRAIYESRWKGIQTYQTDTLTSEYIKYAFNSFFVTKVVFANALFDHCQRIGANYNVVRKALEFHPWGSKNHFEIWHHGGRGAGGKCLKKDIDAFANFTQDGFLLKVLERNEKLLKDNPKII